MVFFYLKIIYGLEEDSQSPPIKRLFQDSSETLQAKVTYQVTNARFRILFFFAGILKEYGILPPKAKVLHGQKLDSIVFMPVNRQRNTSWITNNKSIE